MVRRPAVAAANNGTTWLVGMQPDRGDLEALGGARSVLPLGSRGVLITTGNSFDGFVFLARRFGKKLGC